jgi:hypothetical protein
VPTFFADRGLYSNRTESKVEHCNVYIPFAEFERIPFIFPKLKINSNAVADMYHKASPPPPQSSVERRNAVNAVG